MTTDTIPTTPRQARSTGWRRIGDWGYGSRSGGAIWCRPENEAAVQVAYEDLDDAGPGHLDDVQAAGGVYIADYPCPEGQS